MPLTAEYLRKRLRYDVKTGKLFWREAAQEYFKLRRIHLAWNTRFAGKEVGAKLNNGYLYININKNILLVHRVIWTMVYGYWPNQVDHINHNRTDNKLENLREVDASGNAQNTSLPKDNTSGRIGVYWFKERNVWYSRIKVGSRNYHLGYFKDKAEAIAARENAERRFGFHLNHGAPANDNHKTDVAA